MTPGWAAPCSRRRASSAAAGPGEIPDLQLQALPWSYPFPNQDAPTRHKVDKRPALTIMTTLIYPKSRGTVRLASADPAAAPLIDPGYLTEPADTEVLLDGMELVRAVMRDKVIAGDVDLELSPGRDYQDRAALARGGAEPRDLGLPPGRDLPDGRRRAGGGRPRAARARR